MRHEITIHPDEWIPKPKESEELREEILREFLESSPEGPASKPNVEK